jgi:xanthine dehydrogenase YagR molybdenum-binding subunit
LAARRGGARRGAAHRPPPPPPGAPAAPPPAARLRAALRGRSSVVPVAGPVPPEVLADAEGLRVLGRRRTDRRGYVTPFTVGPGMSVGRGFSAGVHVTEVEVDTRFGRVRPTRVWAGIAVGRIYNPRLARNQCEGGVVQGIGYALYEEQRADPTTGTVLTDTLEDYRIPGIGDTPETLVHFHEDGWDHVQGGGVGIGEISLIGVAASVGNAVYNATGWRPRDLPLRPDRVLAGLGA